MNKVQLVEMRWRVGLLTQLIDIRNFARIEANKGTEKNREAWVVLYHNTVKRIKETERDIGKHLPTGEYKRIAGKVKP